MEYAKFDVTPPGEDTAIDIEATIEDLFMAAFRAQFTHNKMFSFSEDQKSSKLAITSEYPQSFDAPQLKPHILVSNIGYSVNLDSSFYRNFFSDGTDDGKYNDKTMYATLIPYSLTITAIGTTNSVSKDLANQLINYMTLTYRSMFDKIGLHIMSVNKSPTMGSARYPEKVFETSIQILGQLQWTGIISTIDKTKEHILDSVDINLSFGVG